MNILITGGAGFLGLHLANFFSKKKNTHISLFDIADFKRDEYPKECVFIKGDVRNAQALKKAMEGIDAVVHAAAALPLAKESQIFDTNINGTRNVLEAAQNQDVGRVVYISSTAVYGVPKFHPISETAPLIGVGPYGESKIAAEGICWEYMEKDLPVTIIRPKTFIGTYRLGVFEILFDWVYGGRRIPVIGSGTNRYQLLEVEDLASAVWLCIIEKKKRVNDTFNVGAQKYCTVKEDLEALFNYAKSGSRILPIPAFLVKWPLRIFEFLGVSPLYQWVYDTADRDSFVSTNKIEKVLGWRAKYSNADALIHSYDWYRKNYNEIKSRGEGTTHTVGWKQGILGFIKQLM